LLNVLVLAAEDISDPMDPDYPAFLAEINGSTPLQNWISNSQKLSAKLHLAVSEGDAEKYRLKHVLKSNEFPVELVEIQGHTAGATCTALLAVANMQPDDSLLVLNGNEFLDFDFSEVLEGFIAQGASAGVVVFESVHPRYSYVRLNNMGEVIEASEKNPISRNATTGFYWFRFVSEFLMSAEAELLKNSSVEGHFYICPLFNELILSGKIVQSRKVPRTKYMPIKSARQAAVSRSASN
jgi:dTDP-glucose pyrophosphorylase